MTSVVFFGTGPVAAASLEFIATVYTIEAVVTKPRVHGFKGDTPVENLAKAKGLPLHFAARKSELDEVVARERFSSSVGIVVDFGIIISKQVIDSFKMGIINSHFSLLPRWRGADPISYTILNGDEKAGVSLMVIDEGLDTGKLITYKSTPCEPKETTGSLTEKLIALSNTLIEAYLPLYLSGELAPKSQPHLDRVTHSHKLSKADSAIDWSESALTIERKIRAYQPWPKSRTTIGHVETIILGADVTEATDSATPGTVSLTQKELFVQTGDGVLSLTTLQPLGKKEMPVSAFLSGYRTKLAD